eukprot:805790-Pyramimonas_sp.AAC.1
MAGRARTGGEGGGHLEQLVCFPVPAQDKEYGYETIEGKWTKVIYILKPGEKKNHYTVTDSEDKVLNDTQLLASVSADASEQQQEDHAATA